jgi:uronate dehydrogenase
VDRFPQADDPDCVIADLQDMQVLERAMQGIDVVVHLAATSDEAPFIENLVPNNVVGLYNMLEAARRAGVRRFVFASTVQAVSAYPREKSIAAEDPVRPSTMYGATKAFGEALGSFYHDRHGLEFIAVRIGAFQQYDSPLLRKHVGLREIWLSPGDAVRLLHLAIERPGIGCAIVFATSKTTRERLSLASAREILGYEPGDDVADIPLEGE